MENIQTEPSEVKDTSVDSFLEIFERWLKTRPEFDIAVLKKRKCWPITGRHYQCFTIKKRNGSERELVSVDKNLKAMQANLATYFETDFEVSKYAYAFVSTKSENLSTLEQQETLLIDRLRPKGVVSNALAHKNKKVVISIDLKEFFPTITFPRVMGLLKSEPYNFTNKQAAILASLICLPKDIDENRGLPQGAPTSPIMSNLICKKLDYQLAKMARKYDITYTRYADDLTFSTNNLKGISAEKIISSVTQSVERNGFKVNEAKTKVMFKNQRQMVTGILVNEGLNLPKKQVDALRATLNNLEYVHNSVEEAVTEFWLLKNKQAYDSFIPVGFYRGGYRGRYIKSKSKGVKAHKPTPKKEFDKIYALHLLGRILWYGQVVTTGINSPYDLSKRQYISPRQHSRINKYEEMLAAFYRISIKFNWSIEHIVLRLANKLPHLQSLVKMKPNFLLEPIILEDRESELRDRVSKLRTEKEKYTEFFESAPQSLQRALRMQNRSHNSFALDKIKKCVETGWQIPSKHQILFSELNTEGLSDLFHKSSDRKGHNVKTLLVELVRVVKPLLRYLSDNVRKKVAKVHRELLNLMRTEGEDVCINLEVETTKTEQALQAIRDLKSEIRLYDNDTDNLYQRIVLPAVKNSGTLNLVTIELEGMAPRMVTDINAWREALTKVLMSIKQHCDKTEVVTASSIQKPFTIKFRDENPLNSVPRAIEIYRLNESLPFKKNLEIDLSIVEGKVMTWLTGGDLSSAVREFFPIGDIFVHGNFEDCENVTVNLTEHFYIAEKSVSSRKSGKLFFSLQEVKI
ncbi:reverse transcriptase family protein [Shewanella kaireitica]|uniref:reverse transcriptase family protein n=1 Tax=Shewanella kaireitica TaxID=212021 RepID=UPI002010098D|nr:reverse transcriptase family protein [Shewanella kaireitica]MCL1093663.1 reverse transcriptase family protein [Shewanella kaireitica]